MLKLKFVAGYSDVHFLLTCCGLVGRTKAPQKDKALAPPASATSRSKPQNKILLQNQFATWAPLFAAYRDIVSHSQQTLIHLAAHLHCKLCVRSHRMRQIETLKQSGGTIARLVQFALRAVIFARRVWNSSALCVQSTRVYQRPSLTCSD
jgi:hypothetical protein